MAVNLTFSSEQAAVLIPLLQRLGSGASYSQEQPAVGATLTPRCRRGNSSGTNVETSGSEWFLNTWRTPGASDGDVSGSPPFSAY